jgi:TolA-binding protein
MATYKKKGYKKEKKKTDDLSYLKEESTTVEVFSNLDEGANKVEKFLEKNQKWIFSGILAIIILVAGYMWYSSNVIEPREEKAINEMLTAQQYFDQAINATDDQTMKDNFDKALNGAEGKYGFIQVADKFSGTKAANLSHYYMGVIYYKNKDFKKAVDELSKFNADDDVLQPSAYGLIGDAFLELDQPKDALSYYEKAAKYSENEFTAPRYYFKAGKVAMEIGNNAKAKKYFEIIKEKYPNSQEATNIDIFIAQAQ